MSTVYVLTVIDVQAALSTGDLASNVYMMDNTGYLGSGFEGTSELMTSLPAQATVVWTVAPVDPGTSVTIVSLQGQAVRDGIIDPVPDPLSDQSLYSKFHPPGSAQTGTTFQYAMTVAFEGKQMNFDPFLVVA